MPSRWINLHLRLDEPGERYCRHVNAAIREVAESAIVFDDGSPMIPHVTLLMGAIAPEVDGDGEHMWPEVTRRLEALAAGLTPCVVTHVPHVSDSTYGYVLSDLTINEDFRELRRLVETNFYPSLIATKAPSSSPDVPPHITLGYVQREYRVVQSALSNVGPERFHASAIEVSDVGARGTCINCLARVPIVP